MERRHLVGSAVALTGLVLAGVQAVHAVQQSAQPIVQLVDAVPFVLVALSLTFAGGWLVRSREFEPDLSRIVLWGLGGAVLFAAVAALQLFGQNVALGTLDRALYVTADHVTVGAMVGVTVGLYDARSRQRFRDLQTQRDRIEAFANTAADVNNYGRELSRSDSLDEVSALCIQSLQMLFGISRAGVFVVDETVSAVDETLELPDAEAERLATRASEQDRSDVVVSADDPEAVVASGSVLTSNVGETAGGTVVLVAIVGSETSLTETDRQLTGMLLSHAATAIAKTDRRTDAVH